jgi:hypothetical protein
MISLNVALMFGFSTRSSTTKPASIASVDRTVVKVQKDFPGMPALFTYRSRHAAHLHSGGPGQAPGQVWCRQ